MYLVSCNVPATGTPQLLMPFVKLSNFVVNCIKLAQVILSFTSDFKLVLYHALLELSIIEAFICFSCFSSQTWVYSGRTLLKLKITCES